VVVEVAAHHQVQMLARMAVTLHSALLPLMAVVVAQETATEILVGLVAVEDIPAEHQPEALEIRQLSHLLKVITAEQIIPTVLELPMVVLAVVVVLAQLVVAQHQLLLVMVVLDKRQPLQVHP
jgi:hypothetical protein